MLGIKKTWHEKRGNKQKPCRGQRRPGMKNDKTSKKHAGDKEGQA